MTGTTVEIVGFKMSSAEIAAGLFYIFGNTFGYILANPFSQTCLSYLFGNNVCFQTCLSDLFFAKLCSKTCLSDLLDASFGACRATILQAHIWSWMVDGGGGGGSGGSGSGGR